ncbi:hypothetical protein DERP_002494 [Dermatophagoides pteronyssinus]|uniref:Uncharacterized protein n=1 Tax=Dermatophagoides pteronyssinus TaxID=6956 RepID=A0ABQ8JHW4_DERPT|nr:hypothetical protein DERP_002494 [Dermatophagoides pteronyssinus]
MDKQQRNKKAKGDPPINENEINRMIDHRCIILEFIHFLRLLNKILVVQAVIDSHRRSQQQ